MEFSIVNEWPERSQTSLPETLSPSRSLSPRTANVPPQDGQRRIDSNSLFIRRILGGSELSRADSVMPPPQFEHRQSEQTLRVAQAAPLPGDQVSDESPVEE